MRIKKIINTFAINIVQNSFKVNNKFFYIIIKKTIKKARECPRRSQPRELEYPGEPAVSRIGRRAASTRMFSFKTTQTLFMNRLYFNSWV
jgi:hypothetical protein